MTLRSRKWHTYIFCHIKMANIPNSKYIPILVDYTYTPIFIVTDPFLMFFL